MTGGNHLTVEEIRATLKRVRSSWERVLEETRPVVHRLRIAEADVDVVIAGDEVARILLPGFGGLEPARGPARAVVGAWDAAATGIPFPPRPDVGAPGRYRCTVRHDGRPVAELEWESPDMLRTGDRDAACHVLAVTAASTLSPWEAGAPLRRQLSWALGPEVLFVHAGAVGGAAGVALLMGASGAGKSSTALACLRAGMGFLSDDYCLLRGDPAVAHRLHATARLADDDVRYFEDFVAPAAPAATDVSRVSSDDPAATDSKALYLLHESRPEHLLASAPVRVVVLPEPTGERRPRLEPVRPAEALRRIAPSALWQMSLEPDRELAGLRRLLSSVPSYRLMLGRDRGANPPVIEEALAATVAARSPS